MRISANLLFSGATRTFSDNREIVRSHPTLGRNWDDLALAVAPGRPARGIEARQPGRRQLAGHIGALSLIAGKALHLAAQPFRYAYFWPPFFRDARAFAHCTGSMKIATHLLHQAVP
jgi:hypothetical protein